MLSVNGTRNYKKCTNTQTEEDNSSNKPNRKDIRVIGFIETKLLNFFNTGRIRFPNIAANDTVVTSKPNDMSTQGWSLEFVNSGVESYGGKGDSNGIYVTQYIFKRSIQ